MKLTTGEENYVIAVSEKSACLYNNATELEGMITIVSQKSKCCVSLIRVINLSSALQCLNHSSSFFHFSHID